MSNVKLSDSETVILATALYYKTGLENRVPKTIKNINEFLTK